MSSSAVIQNTPIRELGTNEANTRTPNSALRLSAQKQQQGNSVSKLNLSVEKDQQQHNTGTKKQPKRLSASPPPFIPASQQMFNNGNQGFSPLQPPINNNNNMNLNNNNNNNNANMMMMMQQLMMMNQMQNNTNTMPNMPNTNMPPLPPNMMDQQHQHTTNDVNSCMCPTCQYYRTAMVLHHNSNPQMQMMNNMFNPTLMMMMLQQQQQMMNQQPNQQGGFNATPSRLSTQGGNSAAKTSPSYARGHQHQNTTSPSGGNSGSTTRGMMMSGGGSNQSPSPAAQNPSDVADQLLPQSLFPASVSQGSTTNTNAPSQHQQHQQASTFNPAGMMGMTPNVMNMNMLNNMNAMNNMNNMNANNSMSPSPSRGGTGAPVMSANEALNQFRSAVGHLASTACTAGGRAMLQAALRTQRPDVVSTVLSEFTPTIDTVAIDVNGCHVVRSLLEVMNETQVDTLTASITERAILAISTSTQNSRKLIETLFNRHHNGSSNNLQPVVDVLATNALYLSQTQQGCIALMRAFERCTDAQKHSLVEPLLPTFAKLAVDPFGNYVVQCVLVNSNPVTRAQYITQGLKGSFVELACNKHASNVLEKVVRHATANVRSAIVEELVLDEPSLEIVAADSFGNFVLQTLVETSVVPEEYEQVSKRVQAILPKTQFARKLEAKLKHAHKIATSASRAASVNSVSALTSASPMRS